MDININIQDKYYNKYLKYKTKYLELKQRGGSDSTGTTVDTNTKSCICIGDIKEICNGYIENMELELKPHNIYETHMKYYKNKDLGNGKSNIKEIYIIIKDILNLLIKKNTYFIFGKKIGKKEISNIFKLIKKKINHLLYLYTEFGEFIYKQKMNTDKKILEYYNSTKKVIIDTITFYDTEFNNIIQEIIKKKNVNKDINNYIKEYENYLKTLFPNHNFNINGLDNLQFIIRSYFEEIKKGLICSIPNLKKYNSYIKLQ